MLDHFSMQVKSEPSADRLPTFNSYLRILKKSIAWDSRKRSVTVPKIQGQRLVGWKAKISSRKDAYDFLTPSIHALKLFFIKDFWTQKFGEWNWNHELSIKVSKIEFLSKFLLKSVSWDWNYTFAFPLATQKFSLSTIITLMNIMNIHIILLKILKILRTLKF